MKNIDQKLLLLKSQMFNKKNLLFIIITTFIFIAILLCSIIMYFSLSYIIRDKKYNKNYKTITIYNLNNENVGFPNINTLKNKNHILYSIDAAYSGTFFQVEEFGPESEIYINPLLLDNDIKIVRGKKELTSKTAICSLNFYPKYVLYEEKIDRSKIYSHKDLIGKKITINNNQLEITGLFDPKKSMDSFNTCYVDKDTYITLRNYEHNHGQLIRVDTHENTEKLVKELKQLGYRFQSPTYDNNQNSKIFITIPIFISLIVILISFCIIYNFLKKKNIYHLKRFGILKVSGYSNKMIKTIEQIENTIIVTLTFILSVILFSLLYSKITIMFLSSLICNSYITLNVPIIPIFISFIISIALVLFANSKILNRYLKLEISTMLRGD